VALVAALRSELFGIDDVSLYELKAAGGEFSFEKRPPAGLAPEQAAVFEETFARLRLHAKWLGRLPAAAAVARIAADLGLAASAAVSEGGDLQAGSVGKALVLLASEARGSWSVTDVVERLGEIVEEREPHDGLRARPAPGPVVRVMNLHKVKGLEAPVVFLADPSGDSEHPPGIHVDRAGGSLTGYVAVRGEPNRFGRREVLALPEGWERFAEREGRFLQAEESRLLYVAATRAGALLAVSQRGSTNSRNPWRRFAGHLDGCARMEDPGEVKPPASTPSPMREGEVASARDRIEERWSRVLAPTHSRLAAKAVSVKSGEYAGAGGEYGTELGTAVHTLLEAAMKDPEADLTRLAAAAVDEEGMSPEFAEDAVAAARGVIASELWSRAGAAEKRLVEVPVEMLRSPGEQGTAEPVPAVLRGVIDLAFLEPGGWVIADYKTDAVGPGGTDALAERYRPQVELYAEAWRRITGQPVKEAGLYFTSVGRYVVC
jgi:ATP-dependent helicase/nuclease subunit A